MLVLPYTVIIRRILSIPAQFCNILNDWLTVQTENEGNFVPNMTKLPRVLRTKGKCMNATASFALKCLSQP